MRIVLTLAGGLLLGAASITASSAAPAVPHVDAVAGSAVERVEWHHSHPERHHHHDVHRSVLGHHHSTKAERMARRRNTHYHGNPNAHNPEREGYQQQLGNTTGGPRY